MLDACEETNESKTGITIKLGHNQCSFKRIFALNWNMGIDIDERKTGII